MKKLCCLLAVFMMVFVMSTHAFAAPKVVLDGKEIAFDVSPVIENGRTLVPLRAIFEALGANVGWDGTTQTITAVKGEISIKLQIGSKTAYKNNQAITLDVPAKVVDGRTLVPLRFVSEALGANVGWNAENQTISINQGTLDVPVQAAGEPSIGQLADVLDQNYPTAMIGVNEEKGRINFYKDESSMEAGAREFYIVEEEERFVIVLLSDTPTLYLEPVIKVFYPQNYKWIMEQARKAYAPDVRNSRLPELADKMFDGRYLWFSGYVSSRGGEQYQINIGKIGKTLPSFLLEY